jgi:poly(3-hydroxyalkanoate) depolymerase
VLPPTRQIELHNGQALKLRPIRPDDADRLVEFHGRLSPQSRYQRFLGSKPRLSQEEARSFASVDFRDRVAFVATVQEGTEERVVGVARFDRMNSEQAEVALCVRDDYQGLGLGVALWEWLGEAAREEGVRVLRAIALPDNHRIRRLARRLGARLEDADPHAVYFSWQLPPCASPGDGAPPWESGGGPGVRHGERNPRHRQVAPTSGTPSCGASLPPTAEGHQDTTRPSPGGEAPPEQEGWMAAIRHRLRRPWRPPSTGRGARRVELVKVAATTLRVAVQGEGPPLLLLSGLGGNLDMWAPLEPYLGGFEVVTFDPPGTGGSGPGPGPFPLDMSEMADLAAGLLHTLGRGHLDVLGYSWGGALAQELAHRFPQLVRRLVLCATTCGLGGVPGSPRALAALATPWRYYSRAHLERVAPSLYGGMARRDPGSSLGAHSELRLGHPPSLVGYAGQLFAIARWTSLPWLHELHQPTLVVAGDDDPIVPLANARLLAARIPDSHLHVVPGGGHLLLLDQAEEVAPVVRAFLLPPGPPPRDQCGRQSRVPAGPTAARPAPAPSP